MALLERWSEKDSDMGMAFKVTAPVNVEQLDFEISKAHGWTNAGLVLEGSLAFETDEPVLMYVTHADVDADKVLEVGADHEPEEQFRAYVPPTEETLDDVRQKVRDGIWLSPDDIQLAIRGLLLGE